MWIKFWMPYPLRSEIGEIGEIEIGYQYPDYIFRFICCTTVILVVLQHWIQCFYL